MKSEQPRNACRELERSVAEVLGDQSRGEREKSFSRRALLQWSLPLAAAGVAMFMPSQAQASHSNHSDGVIHTNVPHGNAAHVNVNHQNVPYGDEAHKDSHTDNNPHVNLPHTDEHFDSAHLDHTDGPHSNHTNNQGGGYIDHHGDFPHTNSGPADQPHLNAYGDDGHDDSHNDGAGHIDAHYNSPYYDTPHQDDPHQNSPHHNHPHFNNPHTNIPHINTPHVNQEIPIHGNYNDHTNHCDAETHGDGG